MKELLEYIIKNSIPENSEFDVVQSENEEGLTFELHVPDESRGKIIGRGGSNIKALLDVVNIVARRENKRVFLKIID